jgi:hypothetical protein
MFSLPMTRFGEGVAMSGSRVHVRGLVLRLGAALAITSGTLTIASATLVVGQAPAGAVGCGMSLGAPQVQGAAGSFIFTVQAIPAVTGQACNAKVSVTGTIATSGGTRPMNVSGNGQSHAVTVSFLPGQPGPEIGWEWSPHCADPSGLSYKFFASSPTAGAVSMSIQGVSPCSGFGTTSSLLNGPIILIDNPQDYVGIAPTPGNLGYWLVPRGGGTARPFGNAGDLNAPTTNAPVVGVADASAGGYWSATSDGGVFSYGTATFFGSMGGALLNAPVVGIASTPDHGGYWLVASDGGVFSFGDAAFYGSVPGVLQPGQSLNRPVVGIAATPDGNGYWLVASDGGVFAFGDAHFWGSMGGIHLNKPVVGIAGNTLGGYWLVASDGGIFSFDADFKGSLGGITLNAPVTGMASTNDGQGYWMVTSDGGAFTFGDAPFWGSAV